MKAIDDMFQVYYQFGFHVVRLNCDNNFEPAVDEWRVKQDQIAKESYRNAEDNVPRVEYNNRMV